MQTSSVVATQRKTSITVLVLLFLVFMGPILFAWVLFQKSDEIELKQKRSGDLIEPVKSIAHLPFKFDPSSDLPAAPIVGQWWVVYVAPEFCDAHCQNTLYQLHQIQEALGKESSRVDRMYLAEAGTEMPAVLLKDHTDVYRATLPSQDLFDYFKVYADSNVDYIGAIYLIDPLGYLMMHFSASVEPKGLYDDLKRLLHVSQMG